MELHLRIQALVKNNGPKDEIRELRRKLTWALVSCQDEYGGPKGKPIVTRMSDVSTRPVEWLWPGYVVARKLNMLSGHPESGKTMFAIWLASRMSTGAPFPDPTGGPVHPREPSNVLLLTAEDDLDDTIAPRLDAAGADRTRVHCLEGVEHGEEMAQVTLADIGVIEDAIKKTAPRLVILDPIQAYVGAKVDFHRANEVRPVMSAARTLAKKHGITFVIVAHLNKAGKGRALQRISGSGDFGAAVRAGLFAGRIDSAQGPEYHLIPSKSNLSARSPGIEYAIEAVTVQTDHGPSEVGTWAYKGRSNLNEYEVMDSETPTAVNEAEDWLREALAGGPRPSDDLQKEAKREELSWSTVKRAKKKLGVTAKRESTDSSGAGRWVWTMPEHSQNGHATN